MYKVFANRLPINLTSDKKFLDGPKTYLLSSISIKEIFKKIKQQEEIFLYHPNKKKLLKEFKKKLKTIKAAGGIITTWTNDNPIKAGNIICSANKNIHNKVLRILKPVTK